jgi:hypothetical protein
VLSLSFVTEYSKWSGLERKENNLLYLNINPVCSIIESSKKHSCIIYGRKEISNNFYFMSDFDLELSLMC